MLVRASSGSGGGGGTLDVQVLANVASLGCDGGWHSTGVSITDADFIYISVIDATYYWGYMGYINNGTKTDYWRNYIQVRIQNNAIDIHTDQVYGTVKYQIIGVKIV